MAVILDSAVFIHTPKTGGRWCKQIFGQMGYNVTPKAKDICKNCRDHATPVEIRSYMKDVVPFPFFTFVRHPVAWHMSWFSQRLLEGWGPILSTGCYNDELLGILLLNTAKAKAATFSEYIKKTLAWYKHAGFCSAMFKHYATGCDRIFKYEELKSGMIEAASMWYPNRVSEVEALCASTPPYNVSNKVGIDQYSRQDMIDVMDMESEACRRFGYHDLPEINL